MKKNTSYIDLLKSNQQKQTTLVSGTDIKTINGDSVLGSGDLVVTGGGADWPDVTNKPAAVTSLSGTNTGDQDLSGYSLTSHNHTGVYAPVLGSDDNYVTDAEKTKLSNLSGTNSGDNAVNSNYSGLVSNATHTGDATGATAITVVKIQGIAIPAPVAGDDQKVIKYNHGTTAFIYDTVSGGSGLSQAQVMARLSIGF